MLNVETDERPAIYLSICIFQGDWWLLSVDKTMNVLNTFLRAAQQEYLTAHGAEIVS